MKKKIICLRLSLIEDDFLKSRQESNRSGHSEAHKRTQINAYVFRIAMMHKYELHVALAMDVTQSVCSLSEVV